jgi:acetylornithine deacetylase/succinyl-diaminopimelate desuccinylase-like protein
MKRRFLLLALLFVAVATGAVAQGNPAATAARQWGQQRERAIIDEYFSLLSIPNVTRDRENIQRNAEMLISMMEKRGISARLVTVPGANPVLFGEIDAPSATRTLVFLAHYDGQPLDPKGWSTPPFSPSLKTNGQVIPLPAPGSHFDPESRIYPRSAADDKAPIMALLSAIDAIRAARLSTKSNIKFVFEGEEEAGSTNFAKILGSNKQLFSGDVWLHLDGPLHQSRRQSILFGDRGISVLDVTVYGARNELHSGHYGNWAPNPAMMLARLLASMKDENGHVLVDRFYDGIEPLSASEQSAIAPGLRCRVDAPAMAWLNRGSVKAFGRTYHPAVLEHSRNEQRSNGCASIKCHSIVGDG